MREATCQNCGGNIYLVTEYLDPVTDRQTVYRDYRWYHVKNGFHGCPFFAGGGQAEPWMW